MRRMITGKQAEELKKLEYVAVEPDKSLIINTPVSFEEPVSFTEQVSAAFIKNPDGGDTEGISLNDEGITLNSEKILIPNNAFITANSGLFTIGAYGGDIEDPILKIDEDESVVTIYGTTIVLFDIPSSDPHVNGALWKDNGVVKISSGN